MSRAATRAELLYCVQASDCTLCLKPSALSVRISDAIVELIHSGFIHPCFCFRSVKVSENFTAQKKAESTTPGRVCLTLPILLKMLPSHVPVQFKGLFIGVGSREQVLPKHQNTVCPNLWTVQPERTASSEASFAFTTVCNVFCNLPGKIVLRGSTCFRRVSDAARRFMMGWTLHK